MGLLDFLLGAMIPLLVVVVIGTAVCLIRTGSATMAVATGWTGKMSAQAVTKVTDLSIRIMMRMESGSHGIPISCCRYIAKYSLFLTFREGDKLSPTPNPINRH